MNRTEYYAAIKKKIKKLKSRYCISKKKNETTYISKQIETFNRIGKGSKNGEVVRSCWKELGMCKVDLAIKKIPLIEHDTKYVKNPFSINTLENSTLFSELYFLRLTTLLVEQNICFNLPILYRYFICDDCKFDNDAVYKYYSGVKRCVLVVTDLADLAFSDYLKDPRTSKELYSMYLQIYVALYIIKKHFKIFHHDLHGDNVLLFKVPPGGHWKYIINGQEILIPNYGYICMLWDFGFARIPGALEPIELRNNYRKEQSVLEDYYRITAWVDDTPVITDTGIDSRKGKKIMNTLVSNLHKSGAFKVIRELSKSLLDDIGEKCLGVYNADKKVKMNGIKLFK